MPSTFSPNLKIELIASGEQSGTWGTTTNTNLGTLIEEAIAGYTTQAVTDGAATVLTIPNGTSSTGRNYVIELTGALTANRVVEVPAVDKPYIFFNNTSGGFSVTVRVAGQTGVTIANGKRAIVYTNSTDVIEVANAPVTEAGTQTLTNKTLTAPAISGPVVLSDSSASTALRITQTGAGNAFVVEDDTNPDASPFQINATGQVSIGTSTASGKLNIYDPTAAQVLISGDAATSTVLTRYSSDVSQTSITQRKARGTLASPTAVNSGDGVGISAFNAYGGTNFRQVATLQAFVETYTSDTNISGYLSFSTNVGSTGVTERMRINAAGQILSSDGAVGAPAYSAISDTNTGIFFPAADTIAFAEGGTEAMRINSDAQVVTTAGTAALPAITTTGDTNTGIFFPAADTVAISAAGTEDFRIGPAGQIGIQGANYGTSGQVLVSGGASAAPSWAAVPSPAALSTASGSAPSYSARAWVNFNGTGTVAIRASGNVTSITDNGTGNYTANFTTAMSDVNYAAVATAGTATTTGRVAFTPSVDYATGSVKVITSSIGGTTNDAELVTVAIFR